MSREVRRVPLDFDWPLNMVWDGYEMPDALRGDKCPACKDGSSPEAERLHSLWYGYIPFDPQSTGSTPLRYDTPAVWAFAEHNIRRSPDFYGRGWPAIEWEGRRLAKLWNGMWCHHLAQEDVDALVAAERLMDFTHRWDPETGWQRIEPPVTPTAAQVNEWSLGGFGHDSINCWVVVRARCERDGFEVGCLHCGGHGSVEPYEGQRAEAEAWEPAEPPTGDGWQLWETVSEGSPITPVFASAERLVDHLEWKLGFRRSAAEQLVSDGSTRGSGFAFDGRVFDSARDADIAASRRAEPVASDAQPTGGAL